MSMRITLLALTLLIACRSTPVSQSDSAANVSEGSILTGKWNASSPGLSVNIVLEQRGDSLTGTGTYSRASDASLGCGGETIPASGPVTLNGKLNGTAFVGRMSFASTWTPPYLGTFIAPDSINGHFMSVDRGGCPLVLLKQNR